MVYMSDEQHVLCSQKVWCQKCIFQGSRYPNLLTLPVKKLSLLEKTAVDKSAWIKACHPSNAANHIYLFFDPVHLLKNFCNDLFNSQRFIFPSFKFEQFLDPTDVPGGEIYWKLLHEV